MTAFPRPCVVCGARAEPGMNRCREHSAPVPTSCRICGARTFGERFCAEHAPSEAERLEREPWRAAYASRAYRVNRELRYQIAGARCEACGTRLRPGWHCDHVIPVKNGGTNAIDNLRVLCRPCHDEKTRADRASRRRRP